MLDKNTFALLLGELATYFKKDITPRARTVYYNNLSCLTTNEFEKAVDTAFARCNFMPTPEQLAEFAGIGQQTKILEYWGRIELNRNRVSTAPDSGKEYDKLISSLELDSVALKALQLIGGLRVLPQVKREDLRWYRQDFIKFYELWEPHRDRLDQEQAIKSLEAAAAQPAALPPLQSEPLALPPSQLESVGQSFSDLMASVSMPKPKPESAVDAELEFQKRREDTLKLVEQWRKSGQIETQE